MTIGLESLNTARMRNRKGRQVNVPVMAERHPAVNTNARQSSIEALASGRMESQFHSFQVKNSFY